eukprot:XP_019927833.1 PREDICTED: uncharacterized protein LOC109620252 [Crassostrea gigas]
MDIRTDSSVTRDLRSPQSAQLTTGRGGLPASSSADDVWAPALFDCCLVSINGLPVGALGWVFLAAKLKLYRLYLFERLFCVKNAANVDSNMRRDEDLEGIVNKLLYRSEFPMKIEDKRGWEPITFQRQRLALSKRGWEALPLYRRRNFHHKRAWESPMVKFGKRTNLFPFVDTYRFSDSVGPSCCSGDLSAGCCRFCESRISVPLLLDPSIKTQEPCQCCDMSEEFCTMCSVLK